MRVTPAKRSDERGATTALFVMFITAFLGCAAFTVDLGHSWQERRNFITATDAAALASAQEYAEGGNGCASVAARRFRRHRTLRR